MHIARWTLGALVPGAMSGIVAEKEGFHLMSAAQETGTRDVVYNLISVAYHALQGAETYGLYLQDAEQAGDAEAADYFRQTQQEAVEAADLAKALLKSRLK
jgi:hypothetical protein